MTGKIEASGGPNDLSMVGVDGREPQPSDLRPDEYGPWAVLSDDRVIELVGHTRVAVGCAGGCGAVSESGLWQWSFTKQGVGGLYRVLTELNGEIKSRKEAKIKAGKATKQWSLRVSSLGSELFDDPDLCQSVISHGWDMVFEQHEHGYWAKRKKAALPW